MKKNLQVIGITVAAAAILVYPAMRLYKYLKNRNTDASDDHEHHIIKEFAPAYRGKHKNHPHRRRDIGHMDAGTGIA